MNDFSFIHCADLHLDSPLRGLSRMEGSPDLKQATRRALEKLIQLALDEQVDFVLIAGDLYDGDWDHYQTGLFFVEQMHRLAAANISVFMVYGNHDAQSQANKKLVLPKNVFVFDSQQPETTYLERCRVAVHGQSFSRRDVTENLAETYPAASDGFFNIGVLHTALSGRAGHDYYAPCSLDDLKSKAYDYWALGHVHQYEEICIDPWIVYSGNIQGRHSRELGDKGCVVVRVQDCKVVNVNHHPLHLIAWHHLELDVSGFQEEEALLTKLEADLSVLPIEQGVVRVSLKGKTLLHHALKSYSEALKNAIRSVFPSHLWLEKVVVHTSLMIHDDDMADEDVLSLLAWDQGVDDATLQAYAHEYQALKTKVKGTLREDFMCFEPHELKKIMPDVESILHARLMEKTS
ncbi:MAG: DNA repair exonuclease [Mariprofundaceae bacterium]|nr:DNA repair exonuclease [Mariprofundaceae bacterium]